MEPVQTVSVFDISEPRGQGAALADWRGFAELRPGKMSKPGSPVLVLENAPNSTWAWRGNQPPKETRPLGCHFLRDVEIAGVGFPFFEGRYTLIP